jgi:predicted nucleotidyltransferase
VQAYLDAVVAASAAGACPLVSLILFGSAATGGFAATASDVDLILVARDDSTREDRVRLREAVERLEALHGVRVGSTRRRGALEAFVERVTANVRSFFICTRADLLSGDVGRILDLPRTQAVFVDRVVLPSIVGPAITLWGEDLLPQIPLLPIRRVDVFKAFHGIFSQALLALAVFPFLPHATKYAMGALKRSVHNCFFCYHGHPARLDEEIEFFQRRLGRGRTLSQLLDLRRDYRESLSFVVGCLPTLVRLHLRTAMDNHFSRQTIDPSP